MLSQLMKSKSGSRETCLHLLWSTQDYLKALLNNKLPNTLVAAAWDDFYRVYDDLIRRFVVAQGVPRSDVDDCVQEVWGEVAARLAEFNRPADRPGLRAWLFALVRSKATNIFRKRARQRSEPLDDSTGGGLEPVDRRPDPAANYERQWEQAVLGSLVAQLRTELSPTNAQILQMRLIDRRSIGEVASQLNLAPEQVSARQHRIVKKLRTRVAHYTGCPLGSE
ncbi:MAG TPA: sigma-70 family RNA polymerase sigma factor [Planctomycetaceae bacterium]|nr:sigma-70 family RNA polymerase sigma factor [Planctomycetaceae bacterium]